MNPEAGGFGFWQNQKKNPPTSPRINSQGSQELLKVHMYIYFTPHTVILDKYVSTVVHTIGDRQKRKSPPSLLSKVDIYHIIDKAFPLLFIVFFSFLFILSMDVSFCFF